VNKERKDAFLKDVGSREIGAIAFWTPSYPCEYLRFENESA
jgi:hypothetical protein